MKNVYKVEKLIVFMKLFFVVGIMIFIYENIFLNINNVILEYLIFIIGVTLLILGGFIFWVIIPRVFQKGSISDYENIISLSYAKKHLFLSKGYKNDQVCNYYYEIIKKYVTEEKIYKELEESVIYCSMSKIEKYKVLNKIFFNFRFLYEITSSDSLEDEFSKKVINITRPFQKDLYNVENLRYLELGEYYDKFQNIGED